MGQIQKLAAANDVTTPREINLAWLLNQPFAVAGVVSLPDPLLARLDQYERASQLRLNGIEMEVLDAARNSVRR